MQLMEHHQGVVAAGHRKTAEAAQEILAAGGNAFDAVLAAVCAACVAEPVLASLGGGGFLLAHTGAGRNVLYDFFVHTPRRAQESETLDFFPILADFGPVQQEFHIGKASIATPGMVKGLFAIHRDLCTLPLQRIVEPALTLARDGVVLNAFQSHIFEIIQPIYQSSPEAWALCASPTQPNTLARQGDLLKFPDLADALASIAREGEALFYEGDIGKALVHACQENGGLLTLDDLCHYPVIERTPLTLQYRDARVQTNPSPSCGGILIAFALELLGTLGLSELRFGSAEHLDRLAQVMAITQEARLKNEIDGDSSDDRALRLLEARHLEPYRQAILGRTCNLQGTTQISIIDSQGNMASMTVSNGEGSGFVIPHTGIMMNNMLGEADLHPRGFHHWQPNQRIVSMMAPSLVFTDDGRGICTGSGGSNRIRTAILQVLSNLTDFRMSIDEAVRRPRIHYEHELLNIEGGFDPDELVKLQPHYPRKKVWPGTHLFFGGAHTVMRDATTGKLTGTGDPRRGGISLAV